MGNSLPNEMLLLGAGIGFILTVWGGYSIKKSKSGWNLIDLILNRQGSGVGQLLSGILLIIAVIIMFFMKKSGII